MTYLLLICGAENVQLTAEERAAIPDATEAWVAEMGGRGVRREGGPLQPVREAATVRVRDGELLFSDGPPTASLRQPRRLVRVVAATTSLKAGPRRRLAPGGGWPQAEAGPRRRLAPGGGPAPSTEGLPWEA